METAGCLDQGERRSVRNKGSPISTNLHLQTGEQFQNNAHHQLQHSDINTQRRSVQQHRSSGLDARDLRAALH